MVQSTIELYCALNYALNPRSRRLRPARQTACMAVLACMYAGKQERTVLVANRDIQENVPPLRRLTLRCTMPVLLLAPVVTVALVSPSMAFAVEGDEPPAGTGLDSGAPALCEDVAEADASDPSGSYIVTVSEEVSIDEASTVGEQQGEVYSGFIADDIQTAIVPESDNIQTENIIEQEQPNVDSEPPGTESTDLKTNESTKTGLESPKSVDSKGETAVLSSQNEGIEPASEDDGGVTYYDSHEADIVYTSGEGGSIAYSGDSSNEGTSSLTDHFADSLSGSAKSVVALPEQGFHFVRWEDESTGATLSTTVTFTPVRPESGWPKAWRIKAVFAKNLYVIILDPNGGTAGGGGGSSGPVRIQVELGANQHLPLNGSNEVYFTKTGCAFTGWNVVPNPSASGSTGSYLITDGQTLDETIETHLKKLGRLVVDWSNENVPTVTLYAQWLAGLATITYKASDNGAIALTGAESASDESLAKETLDSRTGVHLDDSTNVGPKGAVASASDRHHFDSWEISGSPNSLTEDETGDADLSSSVVTRVSQYAEYAGSAVKYHSVTFTANFEPNTYRFTYEANGGTGSIDDLSLSYGSSSTAASSGVSRSGYTLTGWNTAVDGGGLSLALGATLNAQSIDSLIDAGLLDDADNASTTLYAQWKYVGDPTPEPEPEP